MAQTITTDEALTRLRDFLVAHGVSAEEATVRRGGIGSSLYLHFNADGSMGREVWGGGNLWATEATVSIGLRWTGYHADAALAAIDVSVGWSSTSRTPAQAAAALEVYQRAVAFATRVQAFADGLPQIADPVSTPEPVTEVK